MAITTNNLISRQTVGSAGAATITFSNIPATFTDLRLVVSARTTRSNANDSCSIYFNSDTTAANYNFKTIYGDGSSAASNSASTYIGALAYISAASATASVFGNTEFYIPNYAGATAKSIAVDSVGENNATADLYNMGAYRWTGTAAITAITIVTANGPLFSQYTTASLYGISSNTTTQNTSVPSATGGDVITTDGSYWYHQFLYSGTFTPLKALTADCLIIAGGGAGGGGDSQAGGGGGGGGYSEKSSFSATSLTNYAVTIGAGGTGSSYAQGTNGSNSVFNSITSDGGGAGGAGNLPRAGLSGGSGGGAAYQTGNASATQGNTGGATGYGNVGGAGSTGGGNNSCGGGGGAGAVGGNGVQNTNAGAGGAGKSSGISGSTIFYAGGGAGGIQSLSTIYAGGTGGGGDTDANGGANLGGGGGGRAGAGGQRTGKNGGSGIVIVRYAV